MKKLVEIYVANLEAYNRGDLIGEWIYLPMEEDLLVKELEEIGGEEQAIHDVCDTIGLNISEYTDIKELNNFLKELEESNQIEEIKALLEGDYINLQELLKMDKFDIQRLVENFIIIYAAEDTKHLRESSKIAYNYIDNVFGGIEYLDKRTLENFFDYEYFGRDLRKFYYNNSEDKEIENMSNMTDMELGEHYINNVLGDIEELGRDTLENHFNYAYFGRDLQFKGVFASSNDLIIL